MTPDSTPDSADASPEEAASRIALPRWAICLSLALILAFSAFVRVRLLDFPLERDEGEYAYAGQLMLQGVPPYQLAYNMKLPGTYAAYAAIMAIFGQTTQGIHFGLILVNAATALLTFFVGRRLFGSVCGLVAAAAFSIVSLSPTVLGLVAHATHFVTFFAMAGTLVLLRATQVRKISLVFWSGFLFGLAFTMKQQGIFFGVFGAVILLSAEYRRKSELRHFLTRGGTFAAAWALPFAVTCLVLFVAGVFPTFWFWTFSYARQYATNTPLPAGLYFLKLTLFPILHASRLWCLCAALGVYFCWKNGGRHGTAFFTIGLLIASLATACPGLYFRQHYFIPMLPALGILAGAGIESLVKWMGPDRGVWSALLLPMGLLFLAAGDSINQHKEIFFKLDADHAARAVYFSNPFPEAREVAKYIREHSEAGARIAVIGSEPEIFFYSGRRSVTGYIYVYPLVEAQPYAHTMQSEMIAEVERGKPEFVVIVDIPTSWLVQVGADRTLLNWLRTFPPPNYEQVGLVDVFPDRAASYRWGEQAVAVTPRSTYFMRIFKRNDF